MKKLIKKFLMLLLLPLSLVFVTSCGDDDDDDVGSEDDLIGTWTVTGSEFEFTIDGEDLIEWLAEQLGLPASEAEGAAEQVEEELTEGGGFSGSITFNSDGTFTSNFDGDSEGGNWTKNGSALTLTFDSPDEDPITLTIVSLNSSKLVLELSESGEEDIDGDGVDDELSIRVELTLDKQ